MVTVRARRDPMLGVGVALILGQTVLRAVVVLGSYYWQDDFIHMEAAGRLGLSREYLVRDHNGHLEMGTNLVYWLIGRDAGPSFLPAALCLLGMQLVASCLLLAVLRQLFGRSPWLLLPFACYLFTPLGLPVATWWAAGMQAMPMQIAMLTALLALVRALRTRSWRWAALSACCFAAGLLFWEKAVLVLPALVAVVVLVEWAGEPWDRRLRLLRAGWPYVLPHVLLVAAYIPFYRSIVESPVVPLPDAGTALTGAGDTVLRMLLPGLVGGPWTGEGAESTVFSDVGAGRAALAAGLVVAVVATSVWLRGSRAVQGWVLVVGYVAADIGLLLLGRGDYLQIVARDPRYVTDALPIIVIGVCAAFSGPLLDGRARRRAVRAVGVRAAGATAGVLLIAGSGVSSALVAGELQHPESKAYVQAAVRVIDENPDVSVVSGSAPGEVLLARYPDVGRLLDAVGQDRRFDEPGTDMRMLDGLAFLRPIALLEPTLRAFGPVAGCGWALTAAEQRLGVVPEADGRISQVLRIGYATAQEATLHVVVGDDEQELALPPGMGSAYFVVTAQQGPLGARVTSPGPVCVQEAVVGRPWPLGGS
ncbi:hypothetical protein SAMN05660748_3599 [Blastococcus aggregatus]|uniref:4-amino-4-deoxy-L-arabinose transferase n=1 Tax=Blastococcus aggregatus TaxID=38502 RepID=A0A285V9W4_9ACTN|nr:hypothetical protein [Blastococcus aggregatus]SOC50840.1 hypothetical protein SAMN05660748_3599 [Blastococcus aggregatus]